MSGKTAKRERRARPVDTSIKILGAHVDIPTGRVTLRFADGSLAYQRVGEKFMPVPAESDPVRAHPHSAPCQFYVAEVWDRCTKDHIVQRLTYDRRSPRDGESLLVSALRALDTDQDGVVYASMSYLEHVKEEIDRTGAFLPKPVEWEGENA